MKLEMKLGLSTGAMITAMMLSAFTAHLRIHAANELSDSIASRRLPVIMAARDVRMHVNKSVQTLESLLLFGVDAASARRYRDESRSEIAAAGVALQQLDETMQHTDAGPDGVREMRELHLDFERLEAERNEAERLIGTHAPNDTAQAYTMLQNDILSLLDTMFGKARQVSEFQMDHTQTEAARLRETSQLALLTLWAATFFGAFVGGIVSFVLARHVTRAIDLVAHRANAIAAGDLTGEELRPGTSDQVGQLAEAMNRMQMSLGAIIGTVADTAGSLTGSAASMGSASDQIHRRIDQQSQQTQQAATAMQEMSASIAEVSRHTQSAAETARSAAQTAREGGTIVKQMLGSMQTIATAVSETSATVGLLGSDSRRISQIVTVIDEIARKTNLLALNAAIEAARAGEQGRGFAVVAGEVRRLAESTAQATGEIGAMIHEIQERTRTAIAGMQSGTGTVQEGVVTTTQAGEALERIIGMAERVDRMITQIAIAASQQATAADQSSASLDFIHTLSHDNLTEMATTAAGIESLRGTAVALERQVDRFQVAGARAA